MTTEPPLEPGVPDLPLEVTPKVEAAALLYGWLLHIHEEVEEALRQLELYVPESARSGAVDRAKARSREMLQGVYGEAIFPTLPDPETLI